MYLVLNIISSILFAVHVHVHACKVLIHSKYSFLFFAGYSIFVIEGPLPSCEADQLLTLIPVEPSTATGTQHRDYRGQKRPLTPGEQYDADLEAAMSASLAGPGVKGQPPDEHDTDLATAISMSMQGECVAVLHYQFCYLNCLNFKGDYFE